MMFIKKKIWEEQFHTTERKEIKINPNTYGKPYFIDSRAVYNITKSGWYFFGRGPYFVKVLSKVPYNELLNEFMSETYHKSKSYRRPLARKSDMTPDELISMCKLILIHHGYTINKELIVPNG